MKPSALNILDVLGDGEWHTAYEFWNGVHGFRVSAVAQRVSELKRAGYPIETPGAGGHEVGCYRLPAVSDVDRYDGALFGEAS